jgi:hypothetical protein
MESLYTVLWTFIVLFITAYFNEDNSEEAKALRKLEEERMP